MEAYLTSSPVFMTLLEDAQIRTSFPKATLRTPLSSSRSPSFLDVSHHLLYSPPPQVTLLPPYSLVSQHGFSNHPLRLHASMQLASCSQLGVPYLYSLQLSKSPLQVSNSDSS